MSEKQERALLAAAAAGEAEGWAMVDSLDGSAEYVEDLATLE